MVRYKQWRGVTVVFAVSIACAVGVNRPCWGLEPPSHDEVLNGVLSGDHTRAGVLATTEGIAAVDAALEQASTPEQKSRAVSAMTAIARHNPLLVFTRQREDRVVRTVATALQREDDFLVMAAVAFLTAAADHGLIYEPEETARRLQHAFRSRWGVTSGNAALRLGYLLLRLVPGDQDVVRAVGREAAAHMMGREKRALLAAVGDADALRELVDQLRLDTTETAPKDMDLLEHHRRAIQQGADEDELRATLLATARTTAIADLGKASDCRSLAPLFEMLEKRLQVPVLRQTPDMMFDDYSVSLVPTVRTILSAYPDLVPNTEIPETQDLLLRWWNDGVKRFGGLDVRKSPEVLWQRRPRRPDAAVAGEIGEPQPLAVATVPAAKTGSSALLFAGSALAAAAISGAVLWYWPPRAKLISEAELRTPTLR